MAYSLSGDKKTEYLTGRRPALSDGEGWIKDPSSDLIWSRPYKSNKNELSNAKMGEWFKEHINIWRNVTEMEGIWDRGTISWKEKGNEYIKDPDFQEFVNSTDIEKKKKLLESRRFRDDFTFEEMHGNDYKRFISNISPKSERKDQFGFGTKRRY